MQKPKKLLLYFILIFLVGLITVMVFINISLEHPKTDATNTPTSTTSVR